MEDGVGVAAGAGQPTLILGAGRCRVRVTSFRDPVSAMEPLASLLGIDQATAQQVVAKGSFTLNAEVSRAEAERAAVELRKIGATVKIIDPDDPSTASKSSRPPPAKSSPPPPSISSRPPPPGPVPAAAAPVVLAPAELSRLGLGPAPPADEPVSRSDDDGDSSQFWLQVPMAFVAPVLGKGSLLLLAAAAMGTLGGLCSIVPSIMVRLGGLFLFQTVTLGLLAETFSKVAQSALVREEGENPSPGFGLPDFSTLFFRGIGTLLIMIALALVPLLIAIQYRSPWLALFVMLLTYVYWPMALTVQGISGRLTGLIDVPMVVRGILAAPLEYGVVTVTSFGLIAGLAILPVVAAGSAAAAGAHFSIVLILMLFVFYFGLAYFHGVLGYLMGALVRSKGSRFAFMMR